MDKKQIDRGQKPVEHDRGSFDPTKPESGRRIPETPEKGPRKPEGHPIDKEMPKPGAQRPARPSTPSEATGSQDVPWSSGKTRSSRTSAEQ
jgi:hypothetical protein